MLYDTLGEILMYAGLKVSDVDKVHETYTHYSHGAYSSHGLLLTLMDQQVVYIRAFFDVNARWNLFPVHERYFLSKEDALSTLNKSLHWPSIKKDHPILITELNDDIEQEHAVRALPRDTIPTKRVYVPQHLLELS